MKQVTGTIITRHKWRTDIPVAFVTTDLELFK